jgi:hypothetical protein
MTVVSLLGDIGYWEKMAVIYRRRGHKKSRSLKPAKLFF